LTKNDIPKVLSTLGTLNEPLRHRPGVVATRVALCEKLGNLEGAISTLDEYVAWCEQQGKTDEASEDTFHQIVTANGNFKLKHKMYEQATAMFEKLIKKNRNDFSSLPALIIAASHFDLALAEKYEERIPSMGSDTELDIDALENLTAPKTVSKLLQNTEALGNDQPQARKKTDAEIKVNKKKKKKKKLPKNYDPSVAPDPERWLPKWERSSFKKKQRRNQLGKGSQGSTAVSATATTTVVTSQTAPVKTETQKPPPRPQRKYKNRR